MIETLGSIVFGFLYILTLLWKVFFAISPLLIAIACLWLSFRLGRILDKKFNTTSLKLITPSILAAASIAWILLKQNGKLGP